MGTRILGFISSFILILTIGKQVYKQWKEGSSEGVSKWLFIGQTAASLGFTIYSVLVKDLVFIITNSVMLLNALIGFGILMYHRRRNEREGKTQASKSNRLDAAERA